MHIKFDIRLIIEDQNKNPLDAIKPHSWYELEQLIMTTANHHEIIEQEHLTVITLKIHKSDTTPVLPKEAFEPPVEEIEEPEEFPIEEDVDSLYGLEDFETNEAAAAQFFENSPYPREIDINENDSSEP